MAIAELELDDPVSPNLRNSGHPSCLEKLSKASDKRRRRCGSGAGEIGEMASKAGIDDELLLVVGLGESEEEYALDHQI